MRVFYGKWFRGIRLYDEDLGLIVDDNWLQDELQADEQWTPPQEIEDGMHIVGI